MGKTVMSVYVTIRRWNGLGWIWLGGWLRGNLTYICQLVSPVNPSWAGSGRHQSAAIKKKAYKQIQFITSFKIYIEARFYFKNMLIRY
jgi:hypothetical protein